MWFILESYFNQQLNAYQEVERKRLADETKEKEKIEKEMEETLKLLEKKLRK